MNQVAASRELGITEVAGRIEPHRLHALTEKREEGQEQRPVQAVAVEVLGLDVGCRDDRHAVGEERREEPAEDHGVGDVGHGEFVETEKARVPGQSGRDWRDGVVPLDGTALARLAPGMDPGVDVGHEGVKVHAPLRRLGHRVIEEVHQHRFAATDIAHDVEALRRLFGFRSEEALPGRHFVRLFREGPGEGVETGRDARPELGRAVDRLLPPGHYSGREP